MPALAAKGGSGGLSEELIQQRSAVEKIKVLAHFAQVQMAAICFEECPDILQILGPAPIVDEPLELEADQALGTDYAHFAQ
jgi:hypothetical protein